MRCRAYREKNSVCNTLSVSLSTSSEVAMSFGGLGISMDTITCFSKSAAFSSTYSQSVRHNIIMTSL